MRKILILSILSTFVFSYEINLHNNLNIEFDKKLFSEFETFVDGKPSKKWKEIKTRENNLKTEVSLAEQKTIKKQIRFFK